MMMMMMMNFASSWRFPCVDVNYELFLYCIDLQYKKRCLDGCMYVCTLVLV